MPSKLAKPWEMVQPDEDIVPVWEMCATREFYFATSVNKTFSASGKFKMSGRTLVFVVPADFFNQEGLMYSYSMPIANIVPIYLEEISAGIYETQVAEHIIELRMLERGFIHDDKFQAFIDQAGYPYNE